MIARQRCGPFLRLLLLLALTVPGQAAEDQPLQHRSNGENQLFKMAFDHLATRLGRRMDSPGGKAALAGQLRGRAAAHRLLQGEELFPAFYPAHLIDVPEARHIGTRDVRLQLAPGVPLHEIPLPRGWTIKRAFAHSPEVVLIEGPDPFTAVESLGALRALPGVLEAELQLARQGQPKFVPNDPLFDRQWHLRNSGQSNGTPGIDIAVTNVWNAYRGSSVVVATVDDGLQLTHPDLAPNYRASYSYDFHRNSPDPSADVTSDYHGTPVAGLIAARGNNGIGVTGVAYEAGLGCIRLISAPATDAQNHDAMLFRNDVIAVKNNSWGAPDTSSGGTVIFEGPGPLMAAALEESTRLGRGGRGTVFVFAGGNGLPNKEDVNYDGYANSVYVVAVGAVNDHGQAADYSEPGACLITSAPSGTSATVCGGGRQALTTTDLLGGDGDNFGGAYCEMSDRNYTQQFSGTSAAAPLVTGVVALMLDARPTLGYRDVMEILLRSSRQIMPTDPDWATNRAGIATNPKVGAGLVQAGSAVQMAAGWTPLSARQTFHFAETNVSLPIPDNDPAGLTRTFVITNYNFRVEHVALSAYIPHGYRGDLEITLTSPRGIRSTLAAPHRSGRIPYAGWTFTTVRHWGEMAAGVWTVTVADRVPADTGSINSIDLQFMGSQPEAHLQLIRTGGNDRLILSAPAPGAYYTVETSADLTQWSPLAQVRLSENGVANLFDSATTTRFYRARLDP